MREAALIIFLISLLCLLVGVALPGVLSFRRRTANILLFGVSAVMALVFYLRTAPVSRPLTPNAASPTPRELSAVQSPSPSPAADSWQVVSVVDGDTLKVARDGQQETLRLIGIDTPETVDPRKPVQCFGKEASDRSKAILSGQTVNLTADPTQGDRDKYGRLLRYLALADGTDFNEKMIADGYAFEYTYDKPYQRQAAYKAAEEETRAAGKGLWAEGTCKGDR